MTKIYVNDDFEYIDSNEKFLQLVEDNMGKDSREYIENKIIVEMANINALKNILYNLENCISDINYLLDA